MRYEWDEGKAKANLAKHGVSFESVHDFQWDLALEREDRSGNYGERRWIAIGFIGLQLHVLIYTERGEKVRVISLRKANKSEQNAFDET